MATVVPLPSDVVGGMVTVVPLPSDVVGGMVTVVPLPSDVVMLWALMATNRDETTIINMLQIL